MPHVVITSDIEWDPTKLDSAMIDDIQAWSGSGPVPDDPLEETVQPLIVLVVKE